MENKILEILTKDWQSTSKISKLLKINWYVAFAKLSQLSQEGKIELLEIEKNKYWRIK